METLIFKLAFLRRFRKLYAKDTYIAVRTPLHLGIEMVGKVIEKAYKYVIPTPNELFQILKEEFSETTFPHWDSTSNSDWTDIVLGIFGGIGRNFGYELGKEYLRLDQTWEIRLPDVSTIVLALEHEIQKPINVILNDEFQKLLDVKAYLKVLLFYPDAIPMTMANGECSYPKIQEKILSARIKNPDEIYIVGTLIKVSERLFAVCMCSFDYEGNYEKLGSFQVKYAQRTDAS